MIRANQPPTRLAITTIDSVNDRKAFNQKPLNGLFTPHSPSTFELLCGFWLKAFLSLTLSMVVIASLVGHARAYEAYDYYCYWSLDGKGDYAGRYWYYIFAYAYGCFYVPSDGNLYDTWGGGGGSTNAPLAIIYNIVSYVERGCAGDWFYSGTGIGIDTNGDSRIDYYDHWDFVDAVVVAPPCGAI